MSFFPKKWADFVRQCDPDIITGYNINNFDFPYLINRAQHLKVKPFSFLGRIKDIKSVIKDTVLQSKQMGRRENKHVNIEGRVPFDLLLVKSLRSLRLIVNYIDDIDSNYSYFPYRYLSETTNYVLTH